MVLLVAAEWRARALILAELREAGYDVLALPGLRLALSALAAGWARPSVVVLDVVGDPEAQPSRVRQMVRLLRGVPLILLVGAYEARSFAPLREEVDAWLTRPLRVASVVAAVTRLAPADAARGSSPS